MSKCSSHGRVVRGGLIIKTSVFEEEFAPMFEGDMSYYDFNKSARSSSAYDDTSAEI
jgi:hypothetical protein